MTTIMIDDCCGDDDDDVTGVLRDALRGLMCARQGWLDDREQNLSTLNQTLSSLSHSLRV